MVIRNQKVHKIVGADLPWKQKKNVVAGLALLDAVRNNFGFVPKSTNIKRAESEVCR
jgi:hypothetical protein